jgi:hypothetical protein
VTRSHKVLGFLLVAIFGIYGCTRTPSGSPGASTAALEAKIQRLEEDFRAAAAARDSFRQKLVAAEEKQGALQRQFEQTATAAAQDRQDRDAARAELKQRTTERDNLQVQYDGFRKNLKELIGQAEVALNGGPAVAPAPSLANSQNLPTIPTVPTGFTAPTSPLPDSGSALRN